MSGWSEFADGEPAVANSLDAHMLNPPDPSTAASLVLQDALAKAINRTLPAPALFAVAEKIKALNDLAAVAQLYKSWIAFNAADPLLFAVYFNYGVSLSAAADPIGAINALREAIRLKPDFYSPYINLGRVLEDSGQVAPAVEVWMDAANRLATNVNGEGVMHRNTLLHQIGRVLEGAGDLEAAETALRQSLDINATQGEVLQHWISLRQGQCKWPVIESWDRASRQDIIGGIAPLSLASLADDPIFQLAKAYRYNQRFVGIPEFSHRKPQRHKGAGRGKRKLKIGYVSSDLREHAVGFAMTDVMETHDRDAFELFAYYCGISRTDLIQQRIRTAVDHWTDINALSDDAAAQKIADDGIDILVDLNGYTKFARTKVFALRPAPIAVNWFGFPGTMGSPYHHYIVADPYVIPEGSEAYYSESVLRLPCYQPNDRKRLVSQTVPSRQDEKLPEGSVVYCCLNGMQKLTKITFDRWLTILAEVPGSVLWLLTGNVGTNARLRQLAADRGIAPERVIFAEKRANPDHLARYPLADLFLDTLPYGAHTTAADSLWMGVPIITLSGRSFAARVCGSVLTAAGLPDMICPTPDAYVERAIALGREPAKLAEIRRRLVSGRDRCALFDTASLVRDLEALYRRMWQDFERGRRPVPKLDNLDVYHDIGLGLDIETMELLSTDAYHALYREKLAELHDFSPIRPDSPILAARRVSRSAPPSEGHPSQRAPMADLIVTYAIGDIHGRLDLLVELLSRIEADAAARGAMAKIVFTGDYMDRGADSHGVVERLMAGPRRPGDRFVCLRGNHDDLFIKAVVGGHDIPEWAQQLHKHTFVSYRSPQVQDIGRDATLRRHVDFLAGLPLTHDDGVNLFVHAGIRPGVPIDQQIEHDLIWIRDEFLNHPEPLPRRIVHGHTIMGDHPVVTVNRVSIDTGAYRSGRLTAAVFDGQGVDFIQAIGTPDRDAIVREFHLAAVVNGRPVSPEMLRLFEDFLAGRIDAEELTARKGLIERADLQRLIHAASLAQ